jgi:late competence protein required for DNA uptake (superfamily II DNA/RNA helicase)
MPAFKQKLVSAFLSDDKEIMKKMEYIICTTHQLLHS